MSSLAVSVRARTLSAAVAAALLAGCAEEERPPAPPPAERVVGAGGPSPAARALAARAGRSVVALTARVGSDEVIASGVLLDAERGLVLTSAHTIWGARSLKIRTPVGVLHGRLVARAACEDLALAETQPRMPGLAALPLATRAPGADEPLALVAWRRDPGGELRLERAAARITGTRRAAAVHPDLPPLPEALRHRAPLRPESSGGALVDREGRLVGLAQVALPPGGTGTQGLAVPVDRIRSQLDLLRRGARTTYVGWRDQYRCAPRLHAFAARAHPGFRRAHAQLERPVPASRAPGVGEVDG